MWTSGAGKSLTFQLTAQLLQGITLVVSPLLALMKDQVHALAQRGLPAASVSGSPSDRRLEHLLASAEEHGGRMLLYITPERFENEEFLADLRRLRVGLFVVDEAHSISEWGHTFRPSYLTLNAAIERLDPRPVAYESATPWHLHRPTLPELARR